MKIGMYDVVRLKDGREVTILDLDVASEELIVTDQDDVFPVPRDEVQAVTWVNAEHQSA